LSGSHRTGIGLRYLWWPCAFACRIECLEWCFWRSLCCECLWVVVVVDDVVAVVVDVDVVVPHAPIVSPCAWCAGHALVLIVIVTNGFVAECVW
jgi:hypothetical protein